MEKDHGFDSRGIGDVIRDPFLTSSDIKIFRQFGSLPKRQQPKRRTNEKTRRVWGAQLKRCRAHR